MSKGKAPEHRSFTEFICDLFSRDSDEQPHRRPNRNNASSSRSRDLPPSYQDAVASAQRLDGDHHIEKAVSPVTTDGMDPIVASAYWNQTRSPLVRLPDALIVTIMERLDLHDILRLRHVSRDFMRLFSQSKAFWKYHLTDAHNHEKRTFLARIWATPVDRFPEQHLRSYIFAPVCDSCINFRKHKGYGSDRELLQAVPFIYCAGCKMEHRAFYFSAQQRHESNDDERLCRGREGCITLCEHVSITWDSAQRLADAPSGQNMVQCDNGHHTVSPCQHIRDGTSKLCHHNDKPRFKFYRDEEQKVCFDMSITTHLPFKPQGLEQGSKVSSTAFRGSIAKLVDKRLSHSSFRWLASNIDAWDVVRCFDPNICSCLDWGQPILPHKSDTQTATTTGKFDWKLCPNPQRPWRLRPDLGSPTFTGTSEFQREHQDRCAGFTHNFHRDFQGFSMSWDYTRCSEDEGFLVFTQTVRSCASSPLDYGWEWFVNDESYGLIQDDEMHGISWCRQSDCCLWVPHFIEQFVEKRFGNGDEEVLYHRSI
ncbi:hypothetical protein EDB80DRAFT_678816 [Ilyonectria destructans]|nr:hypothetical protein EDB80DRAFT_678816 [Ilyonectria destructans]